MTRTIVWVCLCFTPFAMAELPPLTPSQQQELEKKNAAEKAMLERQQQALAQVQERIARHYRATHPREQAAMPVEAVQERVDKSDVPKSAQQPLGVPAAPHTDGEAMPQAEAHSRGAD